MTIRLGSHVDIRTLVAFLITATCFWVDPEYVRVSGSGWGRHVATAHPQFARSFHRAARAIGFGDDEAGRLLDLLLRRHIVQCRGHHGTFPAYSSVSVSGRKHR